MTSPQDRPNDGGVPVPVTPAGATSGAPAEHPPSSPAGRGMYGNQGSG
ncbi:NADH-quinone oxidoreductase subunit C, partial [Micromonospora azadirachtae]